MPTNITFKRASKTQARLRLALIGPAGSGKTMTALQIATALGGPVAVMDTEHGSASKYASLFEFDAFEPASFHPQTYIDAIRVAEEGGYRVLIIDSLSHAWSGKDGALELVDRAAKRNQGGNNFSAWRDVTPLHNALVEALIGARIHIIATIRAKMEYVQEKNEQGRSVVRKIGLQPVQRDGLEYEFDVVADLNQDNDLIIGKTRCPALSGKAFNRDGAGVACILADWLSEGAPAPEPTSTGASFAPVNGNGHKPPTQPVEPPPAPPRPLVIQLRETIAQARAQGVTIPPLPIPKDMTDDDLYLTIRDLESAIVAAGGDLFGEDEEVAAPPKRNGMPLEDLPL